MLLNDTTFLLDESLDGLKAIRDTQDAMKDTQSWDSQPQVSSLVPMLPKVGVGGETLVLVRFVNMCLNWHLTHVLW